MDGYMELGLASHVTWRKKVLSILMDMISSYRSSSSEERRVDVSDMDVVLGSGSMECLELLIPSFLVDDPDSLASHVQVESESKGVVGIDFRRSGATLMLRYTLIPIAHVLPRREYQIERRGDVISNRYYLPKLYWLINSSSSENFNPKIGELENVIWESSQPSNLPPIKREDESGSWKQYLPLIREEPILTGTTAASLYLGLQVRTPIEIVTDRLSDVFSVSDKSKYDIRRFSVSHPSGLWYIGTGTLSETSGDRRMMVLMAHDTLAFESTSVYRVNGLLLTSPLFTMAQLFISSWLLERIGMERWKGIHRLAMEMRDSLSSIYGSIGQPDGVRGVHRTWSECREQKD